MSKTFVMILGGVALLGIVWLGFQKPPPIAESVASPAQAAQADADFIREASLLQEESRRGSDYKKFADQFGRTVAAFHRTEDAMRQNDERRRERFEEALDRWEAARKIWELRAKGQEYFTAGDDAWRHALMSFGEPVPDEGVEPPESIQRIVHP